MTPTKRVNKYLYGWKFWVNYGQGWEFETFEDTFNAAMRQRDTYRANCPQYPTKITRGRIINPAYDGE